MYRFDDGEIGEPCGVPIPLVLVPGRPMAIPFRVGLFHRCSSHILINRSMRPSLIRRDTRLSNSAWEILSKYPDKSASTTSVCPDLSSRSTWRTASGRYVARAVGVLFRLQVGLEDRLQDQHSSHLHHTIFDARNSQRPELAITFRYEHASDRFGTSFVPEFLRHFV